MNKTIHLSKPKIEQSVNTTIDGLPVNAKHRPAHKFVYAHYPQSWVFDLDSGEFLPRLTKIIAKPGVNGVSKTGSLTMTLAGVQAKGGTYIDPKDKRLGDYKDYVHYYPTQNGGKWYVDFCQTATVLPTGQVLWGECNEEWRGFLLHIKNSGIISPMIQEIYIKLVEGERNALDQLLGRLDRNPHLGSKVDKSRARLDGMAKAWAKIHGEVVAKAKPVKAKRRVAKVDV
jgi:hypothetical protein